MPAVFVARVVAFVIFAFVPRMAVRVVASRNVGVNVSATGTLPSICIGFSQEDNVPQKAQKMQK